MIEIIISINAFIILIALHIFISNNNYIYSKNPIFIFILSIIIFSLICLLSTLYYEIKIKSYLIYSISYYYLLVMIYLNFYAGIYKSVSIRVLNDDEV